MTEGGGQRTEKIPRLSAHSLLSPDICHLTPVHQTDPIQRARLRWRARRGLLENDLILTRFLDANEATLTDEEVEAFSRLMEVSDNDLMSLLLGNKELTDDLDVPSIQALVQRLRFA
jgi:antitoxin CptB